MMKRFSHFSIFLFLFFFKQVVLEERHDPVMTPSSSLDLWAASLPYIDSDISDSDDCSYSTRRTTYQLEKEPNHPVVLASMADSPSNPEKGQLLVVFIIKGSSSFKSHSN